MNFDYCYKNNFTLEKFYDKENTKWFTDNWDLIQTFLNIFSRFSISLLNINNFSLKLKYYLNHLRK